MNFMIDLFHQVMAEQHEMDIEFQRRANKARDDYFEASKFPRKKKKRVRKEAKDDYNFYISLIQFGKSW